MTRQQGYGVDVETDSLLAALEPTRVLRHALEVLQEDLPPGMETDTVRTAFC